MKCLILLSFVVIALAAPNAHKVTTQSCTEDVCKAPDCRCSSTEIPGGLDASETPQFVFLTFDDAVRADNYAIYADSFYNKKNPDGCDIAATYFTSHEYTDYSKLNDLYQHGHEIALHSISHSASTEYWKDMSSELLNEEFVDEITLISNFANIPKENIYGLRLPFLQLSGDKSYEMIEKSTLKYDCSWPSLRNIQPGLWPYTLDYLSTQDCPIGPCPTESHPGVWVVPMTNWLDLNGTACSMVDACQAIPETVDELVELFKENFNKNYKGNRAPFGFYVHAAWFLVAEYHLEAYNKFVDWLVSLDDVYIVGINQAIEWVKNPVPIGSSNWPKCVEPQPTTCVPRSCRLIKEGTEERYMTVCGECPAVFPWLDNPLGK